MMRIPFLTSPLLAALALSVASGALGAQADVLSGRVTDVAGKPIADAEVTGVAAGTGTTRVTTTDANGRYRIFFTGAASGYQLQAKRMGFAPTQRTITRHTKGAEQMTIDLQLGGAPLALSMVEINGSAAAPTPREVEPAVPDGSVPNPVNEILAMKDTLHLSAVQIVALSDVADTLRIRNSRIYTDIRTLLAKSAEAGDATQMAGTVAMMLEQASGNTSRAVLAAQKLLRPEQWEILPTVIRSRTELVTGATSQ